MHKSILCTLFVLATLLAGCSSNYQLQRTQQQQIPKPAGLHLLTQAEAQLAAPDKITYQIYFYADGTRACDSLSVRPAWPDTLMRHYKTDGYFIEPSGGLTPGTRGRVTGEVELTTQLSEVELQQIIRDTRITLACPNQNYQRDITFDQ